MYVETLDLSIVGKKDNNGIDNVLVSIASSPQEKTQHEKQRN